MYPIKELIKRVVIIVGIFTLGYVWMDGITISVNLEVQRN